MPVYEISLKMLFTFCPNISQACILQPILYTSLHEMADLGLLFIVGARFSKVEDQSYLRPVSKSSIKFVSPKCKTHLTHVYTETFIVLYFFS